MTSKDIIIRLIDEKSISGEEAYVLLNDILKGEMVAVNQTLKTTISPSTDRWWVQPNISYTSGDVIAST